MKMDSQLSDRFTNPIFMIMEEQKKVRQELPSSKVVQRSFSRGCYRNRCGSDQPLAQGIFRCWGTI